MHTCGLACVWRTKGDAVFYCSPPYYFFKTGSITEPVAVYTSSPISPPPTATPSPALGLQTPYLDLIQMMGSLCLHSRFLTHSASLQLLYRCFWYWISSTWVLIDVSALGLSESPVWPLPSPAFWSPSLSIRSNLATSQPESQTLSRGCTIFNNY